MADSNPIGVKITAINMFKPLGQEKLNLLPQFIEINVYQSIFQPCLKAELLIADPIGLFYNYPMVGEENIIIEYEPTRDADDQGPNNSMETFQWQFMVNSVTEATPTDTVRGQAYVIELYSTEMRANGRERIQKAYNKPYHEIIQDIIKDKNYLNVTDRKKLAFMDDLFEKSHGAHHVVIPNMKPFEACAWLTSRAVPENASDRHTYFFFETFRGYNFLTYERMLLEPFASNDTAYPTLARPTPKYVYVSNITESLRQYLHTQGIPEHNIITAFQIQKRWNTLEKTAGGYFENEYLDVDIWNKTIKSTRTDLETLPNLKVDGKQMFNMNSSLFVQTMQHQSKEPDTATRVKYTISQANGDQFDDPQNWEDRWGHAIQNRIALSQVVATAAVPGDTRLNAGDIIDLNLPQFHGFDELQKDEYLAGTWFITDVKHTISFGQNHVCVLNISRNTYNETLTGKNMKYKLDQ